MNSQVLVTLFDACFSDSENTRMCAGAIEPFYVPANMSAEFSDGEIISNEPYARVYSRYDYAASVMHEVAHWCIAGEARRAQVDYGYWYEPDGRTQAQQATFELVEVKPQALERILCMAAGMTFRLSADNVADPLCRPSGSFHTAVHAQTHRYLNDGLPKRAQCFAEALDRKRCGDERYLKLNSYVYGDLL